jgi:HSP20 family protein
MFVTRYRPTNPINNVRQSFELLNSILKNMDVETQNEERDFDFAPAVNTREDENAYYIEADLPGVKKEDINVDIQEDRIVISGEKKLNDEVKADDYYKVESYYGKFKRSFTLPEDADRDKIKASSENGVLEIEIPKRKVPEVEKNKRIEIK